MVIAFMEVITGGHADEQTKGLTFEKVWAALMELRESQERTRKQMQESYERTQKQMEEQMEESRKRMEEQMEESRKRMEKINEETRKQIAQSQQESRKIVADLSKEIGGVSNSIGRFTETMFSEGLWKKFRNIGIPVSSQSIRRSFSEGDKIIAEADVFIENGEYAIPVEVKTSLSVEDVNGHLDRMEVIRRYLDARGDKRKLVGAVAGGVVSENVLRYAQKKGLFVLVQSGESVTIAAVPEGFEAKEW
jgi:hypothetical protein